MNPPSNQFRSQKYHETVNSFEIHIPNRGAERPVFVLHRAKDEAQVSIVGGWTYNYERIFCLYSHISRGFSLSCDIYG